MNKDVKPSKNLKMAAGLVASAAAATVAAMAYKVNEEQINKGIDKAADVTKNVLGKASKMVKDVADDIMTKVDEATACDENVAEEAVETPAEAPVEAAEEAEPEVVEAEIVEESKAQASEEDEK